MRPATRRTLPRRPEPDGPSLLARAANGATCRPCPSQPWWLGKEQVVANVYREGFAPRGCLAAAVFDLPHRKPAGLWLLACYPIAGESHFRQWVEAYLGESVEDVRARFGVGRELEAL